MRLSDIVQVFEDWAPSWTAWERDNVGLQVGDLSRRVSRVLLTLDVTRQTLAEAIERKADLIVSHHPLLYRPISSLTSDQPLGALVLELAYRRIGVFSAHTNLDAARGGVSFSLAESLGLSNIRFLSPLKNTMMKIVVFVPESAVDQMMDAMVSAGAGRIGEYSSCSFRTKGRGSFRASSSATPSVGRRGVLESVEEIRLEMIAPRARTSAVVNALKAAHPYEEVAYDIFPTEIADPNYGMGALGTLEQSLSLEAFLTRAKRTLGCTHIRYTGNAKSKVRSVAVCGGNGTTLIPDAIAAKADVFVTSDLRYHAFHDVHESIALVDAGHWETERVILKPIAERLRGTSHSRGTPLNIFITKHNTNPIRMI